MPQDASPGSGGVTTAGNANDPPAPSRTHEDSSGPNCPSPDLMRSLDCGTGVHHVAWLPPVDPTPWPCN